VRLKPPAWSIQRFALGALAPLDPASTHATQQTAAKVAIRICMETS
jgi:hypothetical protein